MIPISARGGGVPSTKQWTSRREWTSIARSGTHLPIVGESAWQYGGYIVRALETVLGSADVMSFHGIVVVYG